MNNLQLTRYGQFMNCSYKIEIPEHLNSVGEAKDWVKQEIKKLTEGELTLTEGFINDCISEFTQNHSVELHDVGRSGVTHLYC